MTQPINTRIRIKPTAGFTLVELTMAMAFVTFVLLFVVFAMFQVMGNYNKGLAIKSINQTARTIVEEMGRFTRATDAQAINVTQVGNGRICLGGVSYVWNIRNATTNKYTSGSPVTMVRVEDAAGTLCAPAGGPYPAVDTTKATTLLSGQVWVQNVQMTVTPAQELVTISLQLSTSDANQPTGPGGTCEGGRTGEFCAVATFTTTVTTRNGGQ